MQMRPLVEENDSFGAVEGGPCHERLGWQQCGKGESEAPAL